MSDMFQRKPVMGQFDADGNLIAFEDMYGQRSNGSGIGADYAAAVVGAAVTRINVGNTADTFILEV